MMLACACSRGCSGSVPGKVERDYGHILNERELVVLDAGHMRRLHKAGDLEATLFSKHSILNSRLTADALNVIPVRNLILMLHLMLHSNECFEAKTFEDTDLSITLEASMSRDLPTATQPMILIGFVQAFRSKVSSLPTLQLNLYAGCVTFSRHA